MSQLEVAAYVTSHLAKAGISVVLSGGAAAGYHSNNRYVSADIDLINIYLVPRKQIIAAMNEIGFSEYTRYFKHDESKFMIEFPKGPLSVGVEPLDKIDDIKFSTGVLKVLSAVDSVKDRLAGYYHFNDQQSLQQAIFICQERTVDLKEIERWSIKVGKLNEFKQFVKGLA